MIFVQINEIVAVSRNAHQQISILIRGLLGLAERVGIDYVELNMVAVELEIGADEAGEVIDALFTLKDAREESLVQQGAAGFELIHLAKGFDYGGRSVSVSALGGRGSIGFGHSREPAVGRGPQHLTKIDVTGC